MRKPGKRNYSKPIENASDLKSERENNFCILAIDLFKKKGNIVNKTSCNTYTKSNDYRFDFNGQEKDDENTGQVGSVKLLPLINNQYC